MTSQYSKKDSNLEALHILLSPDGYYTYLSIPKQTTSATATHTTNSNSDSNSSNSIDNLIEKNYRKLSLKHHPDRPTGDAETFRVLERAKRVLMNDKLRKEYDLIGLDLGDDDHEEGEDSDDDDDLDHEYDSNQNDKEEEKQYRKKSKSSSSSSNSDKKTGVEGVVGQIAGATVAFLLQLAIRTAMMGAVSTILTRWKYTTYPSILFLLFISYRLFSSTSAAINKWDILSPTLISIGIYLMYRTRTSSFPSQEVQNEMDSSTTIATTGFIWNKTYWMGETLVLLFFLMNSYWSTKTDSSNTPPIIVVGAALFSSVSTLWLKGKIIRYGTVLLIEVVFALIAAILFPIMEMILEEILKEKMKKVGERVRQYKVAVDEEMRRREQIMEQIILERLQKQEKKEE